MTIVRNSSWPVLTLAVAGMFGLMACAPPPSWEAPNGSKTEWPQYASRAGGGRYSAADQITPENVAHLEIVWTHRSGDSHSGQDPTEPTEDGIPRPQTSFQATPIFTNDTLYYCTPYDRVFALDPTTGSERWMFDPEIDLAQEPMNLCRGVSSWEDPDAPPGPCRRRILLGTLDARLIALDADTGRRCLDFGGNGEVSLDAGLNPHEGYEYNITSPPAILNGLVITGAMVADSQRSDVPAGIVRAYDVRTGAFRWGWNPVPPGTSPTRPDGTYVPGTTNVWSIISTDPERNLVFVPTGNSSPDYYGGDRGGNLDYYSSSIVALDGSTGEVVWHYQTVHHDIWDYDVPAQPVLVDLTIDGTEIPALVQVTKMALTFVLNRETGEPVFPIEERPVPQTGAVPGEYLAPTQPFPTRPPPLHKLGASPDDAWGFTFWDEGRCRELLEQHTTGPLYTPPSTVGLISYPSQIGGNNWGAPAVDLDRKIMVANTNHLPFLLKLVPQDECATENVIFPQIGAPYCVVGDMLRSPLGGLCTKPPWSTLAAVDLQRGELIWQRPLGTLEDLVPWPFSRMQGGVSIGGPMVTATGLIFIGATTDYYLRAFSLDTGEELWKGRLPTSANAVPMTYRVADDGRQYVVVAAGGHWAGLSPPGDHLIAFALPDPPR